MACIGWQRAGTIVSVAASTAVAGAEVEIRREGAYELAKVAADAHAAGDVAKVDATGTVSLAGTKAIGWVVAAATAGSAMCGVLVGDGYRLKTRI